mmetsp:Transcript_40934/g.64914  ORF Transcript_40934/g.64914 Transcript_40934/m.64914 type:complete len:180 (-) Transcript_40934:26-565(-)
MTKPLTPYGRTSRHAVVFFLLAVTHVGADVGTNTGVLINAAGMPLLRNVVDTLPRDPLESPVILAQKAALGPLMRVESPRAAAKVTYRRQAQSRVGQITFRFLAQAMAVLIAISGLIIHQVGLDNIKALIDDNSLSEVELEQTDKFARAMEARIKRNDQLEYCAYDNAEDVAAEMAPLI